MLSYKNIVVATDGSERAYKALQRGTAIAYENNATLTIVNVVDDHLLRDISSFDSGMVSQLGKDADLMLDTYVAYAKDNGIKEVNKQIIFGHINSSLTKEIKKYVDVDLMILGATGLNAVERLLIGSVTEYVTRTADWDVLVVK